MKNLNQLLPLDTDPQPEIILLRIVREPDNRDGWIGKTIPSGRVCYLRNLSEHILSLAAGQLWRAEIQKSLISADIVWLLEEHTTH